MLFGGRPITFTRPNQEWLALVCFIYFISLMGLTGAATKYVR